MRQTCSCAAARVPPGRTKDFSGASVALTSSQRSSSHVDLRGRHAQAVAIAARRHGEVGAEVEQVVLDPAQPRRVRVRQAVGHERDAELRVELVDVPVGLDPRVRLGHPAHVAEVGLAPVAVARVDAGEVDRHARFTVAHSDASRCSSAPSARWSHSACAAVLLIGCGEAVGGGKGSVSVAITKDFGAQPVVSAPPVGVNGSTSLLEVLDRVTDTREGSRSITSIDGVDGAWRLWVNGVRVGNAGKAKVRPGDRVWLRPPRRGRHGVGAGGDRIVPRAVPARTGRQEDPDAGRVHGAVERRLQRRPRSGSPRSASSPRAAGSTPGRTTRRSVSSSAPGGSCAGERDEAVGRVDRGPQASGIWARFSADGRSLHVLDAQGATADTLGADTGLVAATKIDERDPVWFVTGTDEAGAEAAAAALDEATLTTGYALAVHDERGVAVPAR